jgi:carbamate kinase
MRIVVALGGNALLRRSDPMTTEVQRRNIRIAAQALAPLAAEHSLIVVHGNGPQVGLLSLQAESYRGAEPYPLDVLDAGTQGMIGYLIQQELRRVLPPDRPVVTLLTMITVDPATRRSPTRRSSSGPATPTMTPTRSARRSSTTPAELSGVEAVIDKDLASEMLSEDIGADLFVMATDVDGVYLNWGTPEQRRLGELTPEDLTGLQFAAGSMGPKVDAAVRFVVKTGRRAAIGSLADIPASSRAAPARMSSRVAERTPEISR